MHHFTRLLLLPLALCLAGCDSTSDEPDDDSNGGGSLTYYGINAVNTGGGDLEVRYTAIYCEPGESDDECLGGFGGGTSANATVFPGGNFLIDESLPDRPYDRVYLFWIVEAGEGRFEIVQGTGEGGNEDFEVTNVYETIPVAAGDEGEAFFDFN